MCSFKPGSWILHFLWGLHLIWINQIELCTLSETDYETESFMERVRKYLDNVDCDLICLHCTCIPVVLAPPTISMLFEMLCVIWEMYLFIIFLHWLHLSCSVQVHKFSPVHFILSLLCLISGICRWIWCTECKTLLFCNLPFVLMVRWLRSYNQTNIQKNIRKIKAGFHYACTLLYSQPFRTVSKKAWYLLIKRPL